MDPFKNGLVAFNTIVVLLAFTSVRMMNGMSPPIIMPCNRPIDIVLAIDSSGSMWNAFNNTIDFAEKLASNFVIAENRAKMGVIDFSMIANALLPLSSGSSLGKVYQALEALRYMPQNGETHTDLALTLAVKMFKDSQRIETTPRAFVIITDGEITSGNYSDLDSGLLELAILNVTSFVVRGGSDPVEEVLKRIASKPEYDFIFDVTPNAAIARYASRALADSICYDVGPIELQRVASTQQQTVLVHQTTILVQQTQQQRVTPTQQPAVPGRQQGVLAQQQKGATQQQIASAQATPTQQPAVPGRQQGVLAQQQKGATQQQIASAQATPTQQPAVPGPQQGVLAQQQKGATQQQIASAQATPTQQPAVPGRQQGVLAQQQEGATQQQIASAQATPTQQPAVPGRQQGVLAQQQKGAAQQQIASAQATPTQQPAVPGRQQGVLAQQQKGAAQQQIASTQATPTQQPAVPGRQQGVLAQQQKGAAQQQIASAQATPTQQPAVPGRQQNILAQQQKGAAQQQIASTQQQVVPDRQQAFAYTQPAAAIQPNLQQPIGNPKQTYPEATKSQQQPDLPVPANQQQRGSNATLQAAVVMCNINFTKVGCFNDFGIIPKPLPVKLLEDKNTGFSASGINSNNKAAWDTFLPDFICRCANAARERKFWTFGIQNYDECFSGHDEGRYDEDGQANTSKCKNNNGDICDEKSEYCAGDPSANFIYTVITDRHSGIMRIEYD